MRKSMSPSKRKRKPSNSQKNTRAVNSNQQRNLLVEDDTLIKIRWLQTHPAIPQNRGTITQYMSDTFAARQAMIESELTTFTLIVEKFPRFVDFNNGALIFTDFATTYPMVQSFEENFVVKLGNKIERLARRDKVELPVETSDCCLNLLMMAFLLFLAIKKIKRESLTKLTGRFLYFEKNNFDVEEFAKFREERLSQPFLLCLLSRVAVVDQNIRNFSKLRQSIFGVGTWGKQNDRMSSILPPIELNPFGIANQSVIGDRRAAPAVIYKTFQSSRFCWANN
ncbi:hypothetical protein OUZ56_033027 [Daphnia magna]|uniref:Uncharacterized protein n=1 Tax=Daphnia magna TaxID=35525 RepID=A0ABR0BAE4_9CRUS|nr:hypothetical protein OUZ56_033027 [Daphnia magna]